MFWLRAFWLRAFRLRVRWLRGSLAARLLDKRYGHRQAAVESQLETEQYLREHNVTQHLSYMYVF